MARLKYVSLLLVLTISACSEHKPTHKYVIKSSGISYYTNDYQQDGKTLKFIARNGKKMTLRSEEFTIEEQ